MGVPLHSKVEASLLIVYCQRIWECERQL
jgi:hypothetical protein